jgi:hypothetical protein
MPSVHVACAVRVWVQPHGDDNPRLWVQPHGDDNPRHHVHRGAQ